jgi:hypothetical protein
VGSRKDEKANEKMRGTKHEKPPENGMCLSAKAFNAVWGAIWDRLGLNGNDWERLGTNGVAWETIGKSWAEEG